MGSGPLVYAPGVVTHLHQNQTPHPYPVRRNSSIMRNLMRETRFKPTYTNFDIPIFMPKLSDMEAKWTRPVQLASLSFCQSSAIGQILCPDHHRTSTTPPPHTHPHHPDPDPYSRIELQEHALETDVLSERYSQLHHRHSKSASSSPPAPSAQSGGFHRRNSMSAERDSESLTVDRVQSSPPFSPRWVVAMSSKKKCLCF